MLHRRGWRFLSSIVAGVIVAGLAAVVFMLLKWNFRPVYELPLRGLKKSSRAVKIGTARIVDSARRSLRGGGRD